MDDRERDRERCDERGAARPERFSEKVNRADRPRVRERGYGAGERAHVGNVGVQRELREPVDGAEQVEREAAIRKPARVERAALRVKQNAQIRQRRRRDLGGVSQYGALVRVRRPSVAVIPIKPVEAQGERERHYRENGACGGGRAGGADAGEKVRQRAASSSAADASADWGRSAPVRKSASASRRLGMASCAPRRVTAIAPAADA